MNSTLMATFIALARTRNISAAACELNQGQSTVSKRLRLLEEDVGQALFSRTKGAKSITLTPEGEAFRDIAERWLRINDDLDLFRQPSRPLDLRIGGTDSLNSSILKDIYKTTAKEEPWLRLTVRVFFFKEMYTAIANRQIDAAFSFYEQAHASVTVSKLYSEPMVGLRRAKISRWLKVPLSLSDLRQEDEVYVPWADSQTIWRKSHCSRAGLPCMTVYPISLVMELLEDEGKWSIVPQSFAADVALRSPFEVFAITPEPPHRSCFYLTHKKPTANAEKATKAFERHLIPAITAIFGKNRNGNSPYIEGVKKKLFQHSVPLNR